jgi:hypothetical protein
MKPWPCAFLAVPLLGACASQPHRVEVLPEPPAATAPTQAPPRATVYDAGLAQWQERIAPLVARARATYPAAKQRYLAGLPGGESFYVTIVLRDPTGRYEEVFVRVEHIESGLIAGHLGSDVYLVEGHQVGEAMQVREDEVLDWTISTPDGQEEGNLIGKFIDEGGASDL